MQDYHELFQSGKLSDVTLLVGDIELKAHKAILSTRSPVFAAMFEHDCKEKHESQVTISDVHVDVLKELLLFIYTGNVVNMKKFPGELLAAVDKVCVLFSMMHFKKSLFFQTVST